MLINTVCQLYFKYVVKLEEAHIRIIVENAKAMVHNRGGADNSRCISVSVCSPARRAGRLIVITISMDDVFPLPLPWPAGSGLNALFQD
jgi:hypothetical protein